MIIKTNDCQTKIYLVGQSFLIYCEDCIANMKDSVGLTTGSISVYVIKFTYEIIA